MRLGEGEKGDTIEWIFVDEKAGAVGRRPVSFRGAPVPAFSGRAPRRGVTRSSKSASSAPSIRAPAIRFAR
jgi:hypothetical protein